jgi:hypothetical protein
MRITAVAAVLLLSLAACQPKPSTPEAAASSAAAPTAADAKAFLTGIYSHYADEKTHGDFNPAFKNRQDYFDPEMVTLMQTDEQLSKGEVGALDGDPICDCQDFGKMTAVITIDSATATEAKATVIVTETDPSVAAEDRKPRTFTYDLAVAKGQWRIHDITTPSLPSLRQLFIDSNKQAAADAASSR